MNPEVTWFDITVRLVLTFLAGGLLGANREGRGHPAGLRTVELVCLSASVSLILANLLMGFAGEPSSGSIRFDLMRLPQGVITGVGFIGAGVILHRGNLVTGVTTAATLWFATVLGFCFGSGENWFGLVVLAVGMIVLCGLDKAEARLPQWKKASLSLTILHDGPSLSQIAEIIRQEGHALSVIGVDYSSESKQLRYEVLWSALPHETAPPDYLARLADTPGVQKLSWMPMVKS